MTVWNKPTSAPSTAWGAVTPPAYPAPTYQTGNILQESGFNLLQEDGFKILYEYAVPQGFQPTTNPIATP